jgi:hypothetical protein
VIQSILFETRFGELLLILLERWAGLAVVRADWLGEQRSGPVGLAAKHTEPGLTIGRAPMAEGTLPQVSLTDN